MIYTRRTGSRNINSNVDGGEGGRAQSAGDEKNSIESFSSMIESPSVYLTIVWFTRPIPPDTEELLSDWFVGADELQNEDIPETIPFDTYNPSR